MKKSAFILTVTLLQAACAVVPQSGAIQTAAERGEYAGINTDSKFSVMFPASHSGPFSSVDVLNFQVETGKSGERDMSAIMGKSLKIGEWEVLMLFTKKDGQWVEMKKNK